ncbi:MAG TPA: response regulator [Planctomycetota bacterium]|nr:response regulator [Planctomycetota bacterium]
MNSGSRLLVADDDVVILELIRGLLKGRGYGVETCTDGPTALKLLCEKPFSLAVLDLDMPGRTGLDVGLELRRRGKDTPILFISGNFSPETLRACRSLPRSECLEKPFNVAVFLDAVAKGVELCDGSAAPQPPASGR